MHLLISLEARPPPLRRARQRPEVLALTPLAQLPAADPLVPRREPLPHDRRARAALDDREVRVAGHLLRAFEAAEVAAAFGAGAAVEADAEKEHREGEEEAGEDEGDDRADDAGDGGTGGGAGRGGGAWGGGVGGVGVGGAKFGVGLADGAPCVDSGGHDAFDGGGEVRQAHGHDWLGIAENGVLVEIHGAVGAVAEEEADLKLRNGGIVAGGNVAGGEHLEDHAGPKLWETEEFFVHIGEPHQGGKRDHWVESGEEEIKLGSRSTSLDTVQKQSEDLRRECLPCNTANTVARVISAR